MGFESSHGSNISLVSVDPAVLSQVTKTSDSEEVQPGLQARSHGFKSGRTNSSSTKEKAVLHRPEPTQKILERTRANSLRRVKNSTEVLRQRSTKLNGGERGFVGISNSREGRQFSVGGVGAGGLLYLRPSAKIPQQSPNYPSFVFPLTPPKSAPLILEQKADSLWDTPYIIQANAQTPETSSMLVKRSATSAGRRSANLPRETKAHRVRSHSFSSVDDRKSLSEATGGSLKIVIHRSTPSESRFTQSFALPTLEVPIPHYRLGTPRFSTQGTAVLRSSVNTRNSAAPSETNRSSSFAHPDLLFPAPPGSHFKTPLVFPPSNPGFYLDVPSSNENGDARTRSTYTYSGLTARSKAPVTPAIFDNLARQHDDPSVVRYSKKTGEIMAASPARIIAQISSESFMDYELVSDFFLTFRTYMSTGELLDLLLARLRWAISRLEDDGRIIRIRTFAALRHWILNYFMDDFVLNRGLRIRFCKEINKLYAEVKARPNGGFSDLKILQDLKRCWNGRCSLYWDSDSFAIDSRLDAEIISGGVAGSRDSNLSYLPNNNVETESASVPVMEKPLSEPSQSWFGLPPQKYYHDSHTHQQFKTSGEVPESRNSEQSMQPISCSIPIGMPRWLAPQMENSRGPHPVSVQVRRGKAPSNLAVSTNFRGHKRNATSVDSSRTSTPTRAVHAEALSSLPFAGSLIRGHVYPPTTALIEVLSFTEAHQDLGKFNLNGSSNPTQSNMPTSPTTRSILGSIRRALGGKHGLSETFIPASEYQKQTQTRNKTFTRSLATTRSHDELRKKVDSRPVRSQIRIDLLCAAVAQSYEAKRRSGEFDYNDKPAGQGAGAKPVTNPQFLLPTAYDEQFQHEALNAQRLGSRGTAQSGSILIVDDTGLDIPVMSGALPISEPETSSPHLSNEIFERDNVIMPTSLSAYTTQPSVYSENQFAEVLLGTGRPTSPDTAINNREETMEKSKASPESAAFAGDGLKSTARSISYDEGRDSSATPATSVKRMMDEPWQDKMGNQMPPSNFDEADNALSASQDAADADVAKMQSHPLRRRPGGDLKKIQHIHDLEPPVGRTSFDSTIANTDSVGGSLLFTGNKASSGPSLKSPPEAPNPVSMIKTHSSQHLRPSFEAAVAGFSAIPDDDDGGLEATLLKLEGKYEKTSPLLSQGPISDDNGSDMALEVIQPQQPQESETKQEKQIQQHQVPEGLINTASQLPHEVVSSLPPITSTVRTPSVLSRQTSMPRVAAVSVAESEESYNSVPLLQRGLVEDSVEKHVVFSTSLESPQALQTTFYQRGEKSLHTDSDASHPSIEFVEKTASLERLASAPNFIYPLPSSSVRSFLLDEDENLSDLSSEISVDIINQSEVDGRSFSPIVAAPGTARSGLELPSHPLAHSSNPSMGLDRLATFAMINPNISQQKPLTPELSPIHGQLRQNWKDADETAVKARQASGSISASPAHIPFILACDSQVLAQQLTLVEKSALGEVEWSDLVEMRWDNKSSNISNWVEYLSTAHTKGIDLVITRFNLVVKWALSEIVLTQDIYERARTITKYIHTAAHARRLHNYATMLQITIALTSTDCMRLTRTWDLVSSPDRSLLKNMEALIQPVRNFHDLRAEMESADLSDGCIPFVGVYIHDLTYNAQKPSQIAGTRDSEPLVNFERYRTAAAIVKGLLRLIDASPKYNFQPLEGVIERCLWMAALSDETIRAMSKALE